VAESQEGPWLNPAVEVRVSAIAGRGLFTTTDLPGGTAVLRLDAPPGEGDRPDTWGVGFPNHSCDPGLGWADDVTLVTMTAAPRGAELLTDYAMCIADPSWIMRCHCPSYRCRQMVEGSDWRIPQLQRRYAGWWAPPVGRLVAGAAS